MSESVSGWELQMRGVAAGRVWFGFAARGGSVRLPLEAARQAAAADAVLWAAPGCGSLAQDASQRGLSR